MAKIEKAVLLAAGRGIRMRELTVELPKPMIEVRGKPVLQHIVEGLRDAGIREFFSIVDLPDDIEATITVTRGEDVSKGGAAFLNERMELVDLREKSPPGEVERWSAISERAVPFYNAGIYAFRPSIFEFTAKLKPSPRGEYELTDAIRELAQSGKKVKALELIGEWADVRDPG